jgi:hypothetical protein
LSPPTQARFAPQSARWPTRASAFWASASWPTSPATSLRRSSDAGRWVRTNPHDDARERLRALYRVVLILQETEQPDTIRAWLVGANPQLDDQAPVELLRNDKFVPAYKAAENFVDA